jgi:uncharacterized HAD superfamily protein
VLYHGLTPFQRKTTVFHSQLTEEDLSDLTKDLLRLTRERWIELFEARLNKEIAVKQAVLKRITELLQKKTPNQGNKPSP